MALVTRVVTAESVPASSLPDWLSLYVVLMEVMRERGVLSMLGERLCLYRQGGYTGEDIAMFFLALFCSQLGLGVKGFAHRSKKYGRELAALAGRRRWPTQSSISRGLASSTIDIVEDFLRWLLVDIQAAWSLPREETICQDGQGQPWHVFHWDHKVTAFRQRGLPRSAELPEPVRRLSSSIAAPGYPGRKRGDVQCAVSYVQHSGSGQWVSVAVQPGNGSLREAHMTAHSAVSYWAKQNSVAAQRCLLISDGAAGGSCQLEATKASAVHVLTRINQYSLLEHAGEDSANESSRWQEVESSCSGPKREARELGTKICPEIPEMRIIASRHQLQPGAKKGRGAGRDGKDGYWYELFSTTLPQGSFGAADVVSLYYGRSGMENQFASQNREFKLDYLYSAHLPGQMLALGFGMFVWNVQQLLGLEMVEASGLLPAPEASNRPTPGPVLTDPRKIDEPDSPVTSLQPKPLPRASKVSRAGSEVALESLSTLDWNTKLARYPNCIWQATRGGIVCPTGNTLPLQNILVAANGRAVLRFRGRKSHCSNCPRRGECTSSARPSFRRVIEIPLSPEDCVRIGTAIPEAPPLTWWVPPATATPPAPIRPPTLLLAEVRKIVTTECFNVTASLTLVSPAAPVKNPSRYLAATPSVRQRRRKTWQERQRWNALSEGSSVNVMLAGSYLLTTILDPLSTRRISPNTA